MYDALLLLVIERNFALFCPFSSVNQKYFKNIFPLKIGNKFCVNE